MSRRSFVRAGYDCIRNPCGENGCGTRPGANHGIHGDEWIYVVSDGDLAIALTVFSANYPDTVPKSSRGLTAPRGADLTVHAAFPVSREAVQTGEGAMDCEYVDGGRCFVGYTTCTGADEFFQAHGAGRFEQPESFWLALDGRLRMLAPDIRERRADTRWERCSCCGGTGTVAKAARS